MRKILKSTLKKEKAVCLFKKRYISVFISILVHLRRFLPHFTSFLRRFHVVFTSIFDVL